MRIVKPLPEEEVSQYVRPTLRVNSRAANYARRSNPYAKDRDKDNSQSTEMLTEDLMCWAIGEGWHEKLLDPYYADLGLSGTLRPDQRPDMLRLFDNIDAGKYDHGSVICYLENRLFRDETQIYYNQFIEKCKAHNVVVVVVSPYLMIYDFRDDFLTEMFRWKCKESADFIKRHIKGWMLPARHRAAWHDGEWAGLGDPPTCFIVDFDEDSPTYKKLIPYWPHIEVARVYFQLFMELGGDISLLFGRLRESPIIFPEFESWVDPRNVNRFKMARHPGGGYYPKGKPTVVSILTNPIFIGYRTVEGVIRRDSKGEKIREFDEPLIAPYLFDFAYYRLAKTDLDGKPLEGRRSRRFFQREGGGEFGLLKFRITSSQGEVHTHADGTYYGLTPPGTGSYRIQTLEKGDSLYHQLTHAALPCDELDALIVHRLMEHVQEIISNLDDIAEYEQKAKKLREERLSKIKQIDKSLLDIGNKQAGLTLGLGQVTQEIANETDDEKKEMKERRKQLIIDQIERLERERNKLTKAKEAFVDAAESDLDTLDQELVKLETRWPKYAFEKRRTLINFIVKQVVIETVSTHWVRIQVLWLHEAWGCEEMYWYRTRGKNIKWTEEEIALVKEYYATASRLQLMALLPDRGWNAIRSTGSQLEVGRTPKRGEEIREGLDLCASYSDLLFMESRGIPGSVRQTNWEQLFSRS